MKKKTLTALILSLLLLIAASGMSAFALKSDEKPTCGYSDSDNNGICDNRAESPSRFTDENENGETDCRPSAPSCDNPRREACGGYSDTDNDGVCDNREEKPSCSGNKAQKRVCGDGVRSGRQCGKNR